MTPAIAVSAILTKAEISTQTEVSCTGVILSWSFFFFDILVKNSQEYLCMSFWEAEQLAYSQRKKKKGQCFCLKISPVTHLIPHQNYSNALVTQYPSERLLCTGSCRGNLLTEGFNFWTITWSCVKYLRWILQWGDDLSTGL